MEERRGNILLEISSLGEEFRRLREESVELVEELERVTGLDNFKVTSAVEARQTRAVQLVPSGLSRCG